ncbi:MAG: MATE family efflux transporter [Lachnospiraceae bacterium]|jgi:putative MATE family efflux protein|nr:MATE family efflux transporter [Lachnospiraceae bacterium]
MKKKALNLTEGNIFSALLLFVLPILLGSLIQQLYITADAVIVGQFNGKSGLAAIDSVHTLFKFPLNFMNGLAAGATILISRYYGAKDRESLHCSIRTAYTVAVVLGILCSIAGVLLTPFLLDVMAVPKDIYAQTAVYTRIYFGGIWAMVLFNMASGILRALGDSKRPLYVLILCSALNITGDLLLVGVFRLGVGGAAAATVFAQIISVVYTMWLLAGIEREGGQKKIWHMHFCKEHMTYMIKTGFPLALQAILFPVANSIVQASVNSMGTDQIAAWGICDKLDMLIWLIADAMSPALTTYTAQNVGAQKAGRVKRGVLVGAGMSVACVAVISVILFFGTGIMGYWFVAAEDAGAVVPLSVQYMKVMAPFFVFYALAEAFSGACCSMGDTVKPMFITLLCTCLLRVVAILTILPGYESMECIVWIYIASWVATGGAFSVLFGIRGRSLKEM